MYLGYKDILTLDIDAIKSLRRDKVMREVRRKMKEIAHKTKSEQTPIDEEIKKEIMEAIQSERKSKIVRYMKYAKYIIYAACLGIDLLTRTPTNGKELLSDYLIKYILGKKAPLILFVNDIFPQYVKESRIKRINKEIL
jgi:hypothetical protein